MCNLSTCRANEKHGGGLLVMVLVGALALAVGDLACRSITRWLGARGYQVTAVEGRAAPATSRAPCRPSTR